MKDDVRARSPLLFPAWAAILLACGCATETGSPVIPDALKVPATQSLAYVVEAKGVQIYQCRRAKEPAAGFSWVFTAPEAILTDKSGNPFGRHYAGPTWEALDGSKVTGEVAARDPGPDPGAIPWLLVRTTSGTGPGRLAMTVSVQRLKTIGGKAPVSGCTEDAIDQTLRVPYQAEYRFYVPKR